MKFLWDRTSISAKLTRVHVLVSGTALLLACLAFLSYDLISFQRGLIRTLEAEAGIVGANSASALLFNDKKAAQTTLAALGNSPDILGAAIVANDGKVFAEYRSRRGSVRRFPAVASDQSQEYWVSGRHVLVASRIVSAGQPAGVVYISAQLGELGRQARQYIAIAIIILIFCMVIALLVTAVSLRLVAKPIIGLAEMSRRVSRNRDYSLRAPSGRDRDEIGVLIESFNEMLAQIEQRDSALRRVRDELEQRVQERTAELKAANSELETFAYTVAHDLRGPLDVIGGISFLLQKQTAGMDAEGREMLGRLRRSSDKMALLIEDLLNLSRVGTTALKRSAVDLSSMALSIAQDLRIAEPERNVEFTIAPEAVVLADPGLMRVVLENLLRNAWKYTSRRPLARIEFGFERAGAQLVCFVRDNGAGFDPQLADRLFKPFQRLHTQDEFQGTGIGLTTVERILLTHGGRIWAEGALDGGATFFFALDS